jgi:hypothetical protein
MVKYASRSTSPTLAEGDRTATGVEKVETGEKRREASKQVRSNYRLLEFARICGSKFCDFYPDKMVHHGSFRVKAST